MKYLLLPVVLLSSCSMVREDQSRTQTVETVTLTTQQPALSISSPVGQIELPAVTWVQTTERRVSQETQRQSETRPNIPPQIMQAASAAVSGNWLGALGGLATAAFAGWKALQYRRQFVETVAGVEQAKQGLSPEAWTHLTTELQKAQSPNTQRAVDKRTSA